MQSGQRAKKRPTRIRRPSLWKPDGRLSLSKAKNEIFVDDGSANKRFIVCDADTGAYKAEVGASSQKSNGWPPRVPRL